MTDKELADVVGALVDVSFIEHIHTNPGSTMDEFIPDPHKVVTDWRVAGALMEKVHASKHSFLVMQMPDEKPEVTVKAPITSAGEYADPSQCREWAAQVVGESLPRAIIEACVEAL